jgi:hypothetical protein
LVFFLFYCIIRKDFLQRNLIACIPIYLTRNYISREKNNYIKYLKTNYTVKIFLNEIGIYKKTTRLIAVAGIYIAYFGFVLLFILIVFLSLLFKSVALLNIKEEQYPLISMMSLMFITLIFLFCKKLIKSRNLSMTQFVAERRIELFHGTISISVGRIEYSFYRVYLLYWVFVGAVLVNVYPLYLFVAAFKENSTYLELLYGFPQALFLCFLLLYVLYKTISELSNEAIETITNFY